MMIFFYKKKHVFFTILFLIAVSHTAYSQINFTKNFDNICASDTFNTFSIRLNSGPLSLSSSNQFILELSNDNFVTSVKVFTSTPGSISTYPKNITFSVPINTSGINYRLRLRTTSPASVSASTPVFEAFYRIQNSRYTINNGVLSQTYCEGSGYILAIDPVDNSENDSPLKYPSLSYRWYKKNSDLSDPELLTIENKGNYYVTTPGIYHVETNYGSCPVSGGRSSDSNRVTVTQSTAPKPAVITSSLGNPFCPINNKTTLSTGSSILYQWYLNGVKIEGATNQTYETESSGNYSVNLFNGSCSNAFINLVSLKFTDLSFSPVDPRVNDLVILNTNAINPSFNWFLNGSPIINGGNTAQFSIIKGGDYKAIVTQNSVCSNSQEINFKVDIPLIKGGTSISNFVSPNDDGVNDTWVIPDEYYSGTGTSITIFNSKGQVEFKTDNYLNNWPINSIESNIVSIYFYVIKPKDGSVKKGSITVVN